MAPNHQPEAPATSVLHNRDCPGQRGPRNKTGSADFWRLAPVLGVGSHLVEEFERAATYQAWIHEYNHHRSRAALAGSHLSAAFTPPGEVQPQRSKR